MSIIFAVITAAILITVGILRAKRPVTEKETVIVRRFVHPGHTWLRMTEDGDALVGMDDFAQSLIGTIDEVALPRMLRRLEQGGPALQVWHGHRRVTLVSPVTGRVVAKNEMVLHNPSLVNTAPYGDGWLLRVRPKKVLLQQRNLLTGKAVQRWMDTVRTQLAAFFVTTPALMYQDGGELVENLADRCSDDEWDKITKTFFLTDATTAF